MSASAHLRPVSVLAAALFALECQAQMADPEPEQRLLLRRLDAIEARIERLETSAEAHWLDDRRAAQVLALASEVLADAQAQSSLRPGETSGWDEEFILASPDGNFRAEVSGQLQVRYVWNRRTRTAGPDTRDGLEVRRAKIEVEGHMIRPELGYAVEFAKLTGTGQVVLQSFRISYRLTDELTAFVGRSRPPLLREEEVSSKEQLAVERSLLTRTFRQTRTLGVMLRYRGPSMKLSAGFSDATPAPADEDEDDPPPPGVPAEDDRWRASTRLEVLLAGRWKHFDDFTSFPDDEPVVALGGGVLFQSEDVSDLFGDDATILRWSADASAELGGATFFASVVGNHVDEEGQPMLDQFGTVVQGGVFLAEGWEIFARYEYGDAGGQAEELSILTVGVNRYFEEHALKLTADVGFGLEHVDDFWSSRSAGWLADPAGHKGQVVVRMQMQLLF